MDDVRRVSVGEHWLMRLRAHAATCSIPAEIDLETGQTTTYPELLESSVAAAAGWRSLGLRFGDRVAFVCSHRPLLTAAVLGAMFQGISLVCAIPESTEAELRSVLSLVKPQAVLCESSNLAVVRRACAVDPSRVVVVGERPDVSSEVRTLRELLAEGAEAADARHSQSFVPAPVPDLHQHEALVVFSSGSAGLPKAVWFSNHSLLIMGADRVDTWNNVMREGDTLMITSSLSWISGVAFTLAGVHLGCTRVTGVYTTEADMIAALEKYKVTVWFLAPPRLLLVSAAVARMSPRPDLSGLRAVFTGGVALAAGPQRQAEAELGASVLQIYGSTEAGVLTRDSPPSRPGSSGRLCIGATIRLVDVITGEDITTPGEAGEVRSKNCCAMNGYVGNPEATRQVFDERGFFITGDMARFDADGYLFVLERIKEFMKYNGRGIAPAELESVLLSHPDVKEACVVGRPHPTLGDLPTAFVALRPGAGVTEEQLQDLVAGRLSDYKRLRGGVCFVQDIPKSVNGKFDRKALRARLSKEQSQDNDEHPVLTRIRTPSSQ